MPRPGCRLALLATLLAALVLLMGAYTRLVHAGLGCPDWPGCYGFVTVPLTAAQRQQAELRFVQQPLEAHKGWSEMAHRYAAGSLAILIGVLAARALRRDGRQRGLALLLLGLLVVQAVFGMWTVTLRLWPQVVTVHLLGGLALLAGLWWLALRLAADGRWVMWGIAGPLRLQAGLLPSRALRHWAALSLLLVLAQAALGGWVSTNYAAMACVDFPTCQGQWWPDADFSSALHLVQQVGPSYLGGQLDSEARTAIHLAHRLGAGILTLTLLGCAALLRRDGFRRLAAVTCSLLALQLLLGIGNVWLAWPVALAVAHSAGAAALLLGMVWVNHCLAVAARNLRLAPAPLASARHGRALETTP